MRRYTITLLLTMMAVIVLSGCNLGFPEPARAVSREYSMTVNGLERHYLLYVPRGFGDAKNLPLLIVLHGLYGNGRSAEIGLGFDNYADVHGFLVAYPDAYNGLHWNDGRDTLPSAQEGVDDVGFIVALVDEIASMQSIDRKRVYVAGASNGGMMAYRLGCETQAVFAGIAPVAANMSVQIAGTCSPGMPLEVVSLLGADDPFFPIKGGKVCEGQDRGCGGGEVISLSETLLIYAQANLCHNPPEKKLLQPIVDDGTLVELTNYPGCDSGARVASYLVIGAGHVWPPLEPQLEGSGNTSRNIDATRLIVDFFLSE